MKKLSNAFVFISLVIVSIGFFNFYERWKTQLVGGGDDWGYYSYLPAFFIQHDLDSLDKTLAVREKLRPNSFPRENGIAKIEEAHLINNGRRVFKYTMGLALAQLPFFAAAHLYVKTKDVSLADGYQTPYVFAVFIATMFYVFLGLFLLRKVFLKHFSQCANFYFNFNFNSHYQSSLFHCLQSCDGARIFIQRVRMRRAWAMGRKSSAVRSVM